MNKLNQTLLKFELNQNFAYDDFLYLSVIILHSILLKHGQDGKKNILNIYGEKYCGKSHLSEILKKKTKL